MRSIRTDVYVSDRTAEVKHFGELRSAINAGIWGCGALVELGDVIRGRVRGRDVCKVGRA